MPSTHHGLLIQVVFSTKQRLKLLNPVWRKDLYSYIGGIASERRATLLRAGGIEDHVHLLLKIHPSKAVADTVKLLQGNSSKWINSHQMVPAKFEWQRGYGAFSVSESMSDTVKRYIENQEEHHRQQTFQDEYLAFLEKHQINFDPRYVFDDEHVAQLAFAEQRKQNSRGATASDQPWVLTQGSSVTNAHSSRGVTTVGTQLSPLCGFESGRGCLRPRVETRGWRMSPLRGSVEKRLDRIAAEKVRGLVEQPAGVRTSSGIPFGFRRRLADRFASRA